MTKEFAYIHNPNDRVTVTSNKAGVLIGIKREGDTKQALTISADTAPALALAILEAAGVKASHPTTRSTGTPARGSDAALEDVALMLQEHVEAKLRKALEAADREALEGEAWELYKARTNGSNYRNFHTLMERTQAEWIAVAKHARTMHKASK